MPGSVQWTKDGFGLGVERSLPGYPRYQMAGRNKTHDWDLLIKNVELRDQGEYQCQVGGVGKVRPIRSNTVKLGVMVKASKPTIVGASDGALEALEGDVIMLECLSEGRPAPEVKLIFCT